MSRMQIVLVQRNTSLIHLCCCGQQKCKERQQFTEERCQRIAAWFKRHYLDLSIVKTLGCVSHFLIRCPVEIYALMKLLQMVDNLPQFHFLFGKEICDPDEPFYAEQRTPLHTVSRRKFVNEWASRVSVQKSLILKIPSLSKSKRKAWV